MTKIPDCDWLFTEWSRHRGKLIDIFLQFRAPTTAADFNWMSSGEEDGQLGTKQT